VELTFRQKAFLSRVLDIYREIQEPLHYSVVAEQLGLSNSTAYDMLRLLEQKGMVNSEYTIPKAISGPGRSSILFFPTAEAIELFSRLAGERQEQEEWEEVKARILLSLRQGKASDYQGLLRELLVRIPEARSPLVRCAEAITALLLSLREARHKLGEQSPVSMLLGAPVSKLGMSILAGLALGLCLANRKVQHLLGDFQAPMKRYEASLQELSPKSVIALHRFTRDVWNMLKRVPER
jgi:DNA-binding MarR family transcriptional regulator